MEDEIDDHTDITVELPASATFEEIMKAIGKAETEAERHNTEMFDRLCGIVKGYWMSLKEASQDADIDMKLKNAGEGPAMQM